MFRRYSNQIGIIALDKSGYVQKTLELSVLLNPDHFASALESLKPYARTRQERKNF